MMTDNKHKQVALKIGHEMRIWFGEEHPNLPNMTHPLTRRVAEILRREYDLMPECGHPSQCVSPSGEGTSYCSWCAELKKVELRLAGLKNNGRVLVASIEALRADVSARDAKLAKVHEAIEKARGALHRKDWLDADTNLLLARGETDA